MSAPVRLSERQIARCRECEIDPVGYAQQLTRERDDRLAAAVAREAAVTARTATAALSRAVQETKADDEAADLARAHASGRRGVECLRRYVLARTMERAGIR